MAICEACGKEQAAFMSDLCQKCMVGPDRTQYQSPSMTEGQLASAIGVAIIWISIAAAVVCIFAFGRLEVPYGAYGIRKIWSPSIIIACIGLGLNGVFFGYLLSKAGSALQHLEKLRGSR